MFPVSTLCLVAWPILETNGPRLRRRLNLGFRWIWSIPLRPNSRRFRGRRQLKQASLKSARKRRINISPDLRDELVSLSEQRQKADLHSQIEPLSLIMLQATTRKYALGCMPPTHRPDLGLKYPSSAKTKKRTIGILGLSPLLDQLNNKRRTRMKDKIKVLPNTEHFYLKYGWLYLFFWKTDLYFCHIWPGRTERKAGEGEGKA